MATDYLAAARDAAKDADEYVIGAQGPYLARVQAFATLAVADALGRLADTATSVDLPSGAEDTDEDARQVSPEQIEHLAHRVCQQGGHIPNRDRSTPGSCDFHRTRALEYAALLGLGVEVRRG